MVYKKRRCKLLPKAGVQKTELYSVFYAPLKKAKYPFLKEINTNVMGKAVKAVLGNQHTWMPL